MNKNILVTVLVGSLFGMAACSQKPQPIQNQLAAQAAYIDRTVSECKAYLGGIDGIGKLKSASNKLKANARNRGASDADFKKGFNKAALAWSISVGMTNKMDTCSDFVDGSYDIMMSVQ